MKRNGKWRKSLSPVENWRSITLIIILKKMKGPPREKDFPRSWRNL